MFSIDDINTVITNNGKTIKVDLANYTKVGHTHKIVDVSDLEEQLAKKLQRTTPIQSRRSKTFELSWMVSQTLVILMIFSPSRTMKSWTNSRTLTSYAFYLAKR